MDNVVDEEVLRMLEEITNEAFQESTALVTKDKTILKENSKSLFIDETSSRFSGAVWANKIKETNVVLAGLGGIGSYVAFLLSRLKVKSLYLYDPDIVDSTNMSGQLYSANYIGKSKVNAISSIINQFSNYYNTNAIHSRYGIGCIISKVMMCGFDNMNARHIFYKSWKRAIIDKEASQYIFIDGRLAAEEFQVFCIRGDDKYHMKEYEEKWLFSDDEAEETICSYKQTSFCANMIASVMVNLFVNFIANMCEPLIERDLPFLTRYDASTMYFKTES